MRFEWDPAKEKANRRKHGLSFAEVTAVFTGTEDYLELEDEAHSVHEERFIAIGPTQGGLVVVVFTEPHEDVVRIVSARKATRREERLFRGHMRDTR